MHILFKRFGGICFLFKLQKCFFPWHSCCHRSASCETFCWFVGGTDWITWDNWTHLSAVDPKTELDIKSSHWPNSVFASRSKELLTRQSQVSKHFSKLNSDNANSEFNLIGHLISPDEGWILSFKDKSLDFKNIDVVIISYKSNKQTKAVCIYYHPFKCSKNLNHKSCLYLQNPSSEVYWKSSISLSLSPEYQLTLNQDRWEGNPDTNTDNITYLGINISSRLPELVNFNPLLRKHRTTFSAGWIYQ